MTMTRRNQLAYDGTVIRMPWKDGSFGFLYNSSRSHKSYKQECMYVNVNA